MQIIGAIQQYRTYVLGFALLFLQSQSVRSGLVHSFVRDATIFAGIGYLSAHGVHEMATFTKLPSGSWRVQARHVNESFLCRKDAEEWALESNAASTAANRFSQVTLTKPRPSAILFGLIAMIFAKSVNG